MLPKAIRISTVESCAWQKWAIDSFRWNYLVQNRPLKYPSSVFKRLNALPIHKTWALQDNEHGRTWSAGSQASFPLNFQYLERYGGLTVPIERTTWAQAGSSEPGVPLKRRITEFELFYAPFSFFLKWTKQKLASPETFQPNESLYLAQFPIPTEFEKDLPTPAYVARIDSRTKSAEPRRLRVPESTSLWMGIPPTETPLHKDPNENFFVQIAGHKIIRLLRPDDGELLLQMAKRTIAEGQGPGWLQNSSIRGQEMMVGPERDLMTDLLWNLPLAPTKKEMRRIEETLDSPSRYDFDKELLDSGELPLTRGGEVDGKSGIADLTELSAANGIRLDAEDVLSIHEIPLGPGDAAFIPKGWYHTVRSVGDHSAGINISANWWFRGGPKINRGVAVKEMKHEREERAKSWKRQLAQAVGDDRAGMPRAVVRVVPSGLEARRATTPPKSEAPLWQQRLAAKRWRKGESLHKPPS